MAYGIGQQLDQLKGLSIQELMQRQSVDPQLVYALALQEKQKMEAAKERQAAMGMETSQGTEIEKMEADLASRRAPGVQMAAQRSMPQPQMSQGIAGVPSPNMGAIGINTRPTTTVSRLVQLLTPSSPLNSWPIPVQVPSAIRCTNTCDGSWYVVSGIPC